MKHIRPLPSTGRRERGSVLIISLWLILGLVSLALLFGHAMMLEYRAAASVEGTVRSEQVASGAERYVAYVLGELADAGVFPAAEDYESDRVAVGNGAFWLLGRHEEPDGESEPAFGLLDEASKINLNTATREMLEALPGMTSELAAAILDWRDEDDDITDGGAESETYSRMDPSYRCKNGAFETVGELRLVANADTEILCGRDRNLNGVIDPWEDTGDGDGFSSAPAEDFGIFEYVTVYSREPNVRADGSSRVNLNGNAQQVQQTLEQTLGRPRAEQVVAAAGIGQRQVNSLLELYVRGRLTAEEFTQLEDVFTTTDDPYIVGRVNVNTASRVVLECIPGIGADYADQLISRRTEGDELPAAITWLTEILDPESSVAAGPYVTVRSYCVAADVVAVGGSGSGFSRTFVVLDTTGDEPVPVFRQDRSALGWPLGAALREDLEALMAEDLAFR